jgi:hypothetical protein
MPPLIRFLVSGRRKELATIMASLWAELGWGWAKADQNEAPRN